MKRDYLALWSLLAVAFVALFIYSVWGEELQAKGVPLKPSALAQVFEPETVAIADSDSFDVDSMALALMLAEPEPVVEIDTVPKTILFIGDSMLEGLSPRLAAYCDVSGHKLYTVIWYSSTTEIWGNAGLISRYIRDINPDYIFICLGANELFVSDIAKKRAKPLKSMLDEIGEIPYLWIGPPNWKPDTGINDLIAANVGKGEFFLTNGMKFNRKKDGAHPTAESAIEWMDSIVRWMPANCAHPILLNEPEKRTSRPVRIFVHQPGPNP